jgi:hypothetical protein
MSTKKKGWLARSLDVTTHGPGRVAAAVALGTLAGLAPCDSGLFVLALFLVVFTEASTVTGLAALLAAKGASFALDPQLAALGRSLHEGSSHAQEVACSLPLVALLGLERHSVLGALVAGAAVGPLLGLVAFFIQKKIVAAREARERKERRKKKDEWQPRVRQRWTEEVWEQLPPLRKWFALAAVVALVQLLGSGAAARWLLEDELPALIALETGWPATVSAERVEASLLGARLHATNVVIRTERASFTTPELDLELDGISLLRRRLVAKLLRVKGGRLVLEKGAWPLPPQPLSRSDDRSEALASRPRWTIWHGELEDLEVELRDGAAPRTLRARSGELSDVAPRGRGSSLSPPELHVRGDGFALDLGG